MAAESLRSVQVCKECQRSINAYNPEPWRGSTHCAACAAAKGPDFDENGYNHNQPLACDKCVDMIWLYKKGFCAVHHQGRSDLKDAAIAACAVLEQGTRHQAGEFNRGKCGGCDYVFPGADP